MVLLEKPIAVVLSNCMGGGGWRCPSSSSVVRTGKASLAFINVAPILASAAEDMAFLMGWHMVCMALLLVGRVGGLLQFLRSWLARKKWPLDWLRARSLQR